MSDVSKDELKKIPLVNIRESAVALREVDRESEKYKELVQSIRIKGILNPISVRPIENPNKDDKTQLYSICDGLHRTTGARDAGLTEIPALIKDMTDAEVEEAQIMANIHRIETTPAQYTEQLVRMINRNPHLTLPEIASRLGKSITWLSDRLSLMKLIDKAKELLDAGLIKVTNAVALSKLDPSLQPDWLDRAQTLPQTEFIPAVETAKKVWRQAIIQGRAGQVPTFVHTPVLRKASEIKLAFENPAPIAAELIALEQPTSLAEAFLLGLKFAMRSDKKSIEEQRIKWQAEQDDKARKAKEAKEQRDKKRAEALGSNTLVPITPVNVPAPELAKV